MSQAITETSLIPGAERRTYEGLGRSAHWVLRIALASVFIFHGADKFAGLNEFAQMMNLPYAIAFLVASVPGVILALTIYFTVREPPRTTAKPKSGWLRETWESVSLVGRISRVRRFLMGGTFYGM